MKNALASPFFAIVQAEVRFNFKRAAPYALAAVFTANAVLWWGWGPAIARGWAVNSDFFLTWLFGGFSFMTLPIFIAVMMGDAVARDHELDIAPLILSAPVSRAEYITAKFVGNFLVFAGCQVCFALVLIVLQMIARPGMIVLAQRVWPYPKHFVFFVVISSLLPAAVDFAIGTLTRNLKIVYGLAVGFYPLYIGWQLALKVLPVRWRVWLDPLLFNYAGENWKVHTAEVLNQMTVSYDVGVIANRLALVCLSFICLAFTWRRFAAIEEKGVGSAPVRNAVIGLTAPNPDLPVPVRSQLAVARPLPTPERAGGPASVIPSVTIQLEGWRARLRQVSAAAGAEIRLLRSERSLLVIVPITVTACLIELVVYRIESLTPYSALFASRIASTLLLFLFGIAVFYTGEAWHRDHASKIVSLISSTPAPDLVLLLAKASGTFAISFNLILICTALAIALQAIEGHWPLRAGAYVIANLVILLPSVVFMIAAALALNVVLRDRYLVYAISLAAGGALYFVTGQGHIHWLYNPVLLRAWDADALAWNSAQLPTLLLSRIHALLLSAILIVAALLLFKRRVRLS